MPASGGDTYTVTYNTNGGTGTVTADTVTAGDSLDLDDGTTITAPEGKEFVGWALAPESASILVSPYTPSGDVTLYAIYVDA